MLAGRATLAHSVTITIPSYTMLTFKLPASVCDRLDRLNRNFSWGDTPERKKLHLVKWEQVCKDKWGLGIKSAEKQNLALLAKLGWKVNVQDDSLWANILRDKYLNNHDISSWPRNRPASHIWRGIVDSHSDLQKGLKWVIGDGKRVDIWKDWWSGDTPLALLYPGVHTTLNSKVEELIDNGRWNLDWIAQIVDQGVIDSILGIKLPPFTQVPDHPSWVGSPSGNFSVAATYKLINKDVTDIRGWKWFWKLKIPAKLKTFI